MVRAIGVCACLVALAGAIGTQGKAADPKPPVVVGAAPMPITEMRIGLPKPMFRDVPQSLVDAAATPFQQMIKDKVGVSGLVEIVEDYKVLVQKMQAGKIDLAVFHGFEYAWVKDTPGLVPLVVTVPHCGKVQACLVVHKDSKVLEAKDLKGACVLMPKGSKAHTHMFLERLRAQLPVGDCCPAKMEGLNSEEILVEVATKRADAALVDISALNALSAAYPACFKQLRILSESESLPSAVVVYRKDAMPNVTVEKLRAGLLDCVKTYNGRLFLTFWSLKGFEDVSPAYHGLCGKCCEKYPAPAEKPAAAPPVPQAPPPR